MNSTTAEQIKAGHAAEIKRQEQERQAAQKKAASRR